MRRRPPASDGIHLPCGDTGALAAALHRALVQVAAQHVRPLMRGRATRYWVARTAAGFEHAALAAAR